MKPIVGRDIGTYTFDASAQTITITGVPNLQIQDFDIITNQTDGILMYNFASAALGGALSGGVLTLTYDTTSMSDTDELQIRLNQNYGIDYNLNAQLSIPQANAPIVSDSYTSLVASGTVIASATSTWENLGSAIDVRSKKDISFLLTQTHVGSTAVEFRIQCSDSSDGTYYLPIDTAYSIVAGDTTGTKEFGFDVRRFNYVRLQGYVETAATDTAAIEYSSTLI